MRVLVVDDETHIVKYLVASLEAEGFAVDSACDGLTARDMALAGVYDAITLDIMLPGMNGYDVCREIRAAGIDTPVLMLTAKDGEYDEADALDIGADDFLRKPFSLVVLIARLRALVRRQAGSRSAALAVGDLTLDSQERVAKRAGVEIGLTPREFALLEYFMLNAGQTLSKSQLLERVWGIDFAADENVVEVYVGYLRKKIDAGFGTPLIKTVRGMGYKIEGPAE